MKLFDTDVIQPVGTIPELLSHIKKNRDLCSPAISFVKGPVESVRYKYDDYFNAIDRWSAIFVGMDIKPGDRVSTLLKNRLEVPIIYLALMSIGAVVVPLNPSYTDRELDFVMTDSGSIGLLTDIETLGMRDRDFSKCRFVVDIDTVRLPDTAVLPNIELSGLSPAITLYTSGTTAFPKGVVQMHGNLIANAWSMVKAMDITEPVQLSVMPFYHAHAVGFGRMTCLLSGGHLVVAERMDPIAWPQVIRSLKVTITSMVPNLLHLLERTGVTQDDVPSLRFIFVSAAPLPSTLAQKFEHRSGIYLAHAWGLSEFTNFATCLPVTISRQVREELMFGEPTPCVGSPLDGVDVQVRRNDGSIADDGELGELWLRGPSLTLGYHNNPSATEEAIVNGWLRSGDEGYARNRFGASYFFITDRIKDVIVRSGEKISPMAIEAMIVSRIPSLVNNIVALGFEHTLYGEEVGLVVEESTIGEDPGALKQVIGDLPVRMRPKIILYGNGVIPRTHTGKIQRRLLRGHFARYASDSAAYRFEPIVGAMNHA